MPAPPMTVAKIAVCVTLMSPIAIGRRAVRAMRASISRSARQLTAKAAPASNQMPTVAATSRCQSGMQSLARNMPITAQKTASCVTRGLVSAQYWEARLAVLDVAVCVVIGGAWGLSDTDLYWLMITFAGQRRRAG